MKLNERKEKKMRESNFRFFMEQVKELEKEHRGQFAVIYKKKITGFFNDFNDARNYAEENYKDGAYLIQPCEYELNIAKSRRITGKING
ncbi:MAG: hypothetical protein FWH10_06005 [Oscillospiraceae bacterium]|nr:hypothetical protein [Oscillospiraceae bacterium]